MKLSQIRDVVAIVEHGSLRAAAQRLGLAQPALTRSIRELERELGVSLFERHAHGMKLTVMGDAFIPRARAVQAEIRHSHEEINQLKGLMTGQVSIGLSMASSIVFLPSLLKSLLKRFPGVRLKVSEGLFPEMRLKIIEGEVDFYVGPVIEKPQPRELLVEELIKSERIVLGRVGHPLQGARSLAELASAQWVGISIAATGLVEPRGIFKLHGLREPTIEIETQSALSTIIIAAKSDLLAMLPRMCLRCPGVDKLLKQIKVEKIAAPTICLIRRATLPLTPAAEFLSDVVRRAASVEKTL
jgi:LysR family transcriptional regulator of abg operon